MFSKQVFRRPIETACTLAPKGFSAHSTLLFAVKEAQVVVHEGDRRLSAISRMPTFWPAKI
jgi:hypothetical protein